MIAQLTSRFSSCHFFNKLSAPVVEICMSSLLYCQLSGLECDCNRGIKLGGSIIVGCGETVHSANHVAQARKSELGEANGACAGCSHCVRRTGPEARIERADLCELREAKAMVSEQ